MQYLQRAAIKVRVADGIISGFISAKKDQPQLVLAAGDAARFTSGEMLEARKRVNAVKDIPFIILDPQNEERLECFRMGCDDFIHIPFDETEVFLRICSLLRRYGGNSGGLRGSFSEINSFDLIQLLITARRTGVLTIELDKDKILLYFKDGQVFHAESRNTNGEGAFVEAMRFSNKNKEATFVFSVDVPSSVPTTVEKRTDHLLLSCAQAMDES